MTFLAEAGPARRYLFAMATLVVMALPSERVHAQDDATLIDPLAPTLAELPHQDIHLAIDHEHGVLEGRYQLTLAGDDDVLGAPMAFALLRGAVESVRVNGEPFEGYVYELVPGMTEAQAETYDLMLLTLDLSSLTPLTADFVTLEITYRDDHFYGRATNPEDDMPFSLGQINADQAFSSHINAYPFAEGLGQTADIWLMTSLSGVDAITSGRLVASTPGFRDPADGGTTFHFRTEAPSGLLPYPFAIAHFERLEETASDGHTILRILYDPEDAAYAVQKMPVIQHIFTTYVALFGDYPFPSLTLVETHLNEGNIGLAAQSVIMLSKNIWFARDLDTTDTNLTNLPLLVLADEINHQWNAYKVDSPNYLAEGISRYVDSLYMASLGGPEVLNEHMQQTAASYFYLVGAAGIEDRPINDPEVYPALYFIKGALALHMLHGMLGEDAFAAAMRRYFDDYAGQSTTLDDLRAAFEAEYGDDLTWFFEQWYASPGWPQLSLAWETVEAHEGVDNTSANVIVDITQHQEPLFTLVHVPVDIALADGSHVTEYVDVSRTSERFGPWTLLSEPVDVQLDPDGWVLDELVPAASSPVVGEPPADDGTRDEGETVPPNVIDGSIQVDGAHRSCTSDAQCTGFYAECGHWAGACSGVNIDFLAIYEAAQTSLCVDTPPNADNYDCHPMYGIEKAVCFQGQCRMEREAE